MFLHHLRHLRKGRAAQRSLAAAMGVSATVFAIVRNTQEQENLEERVEASPVDWWTTPQFGDVFARQHLLPRPCLCDSGSFLSQQRSILEARCRNLTKRITDTTSHGSLESAYRVKWDAPLGEGGFGAVYAATNRATGEAVACKKICKTYTDDIGFQREMEAFLHLRSNGGHPNIIRLRENFDEGGDYYLIMDLISGGEMFDHLINNGPYSEADAARLMREIASALAFIHGIGCVHGDLKPENLMLSTPKTSDAVVKLIDFGSAQVETGTIPPSAGNTWAYCPPEVLDPKKRNKKDCAQKMESSLDMWSLGVILYMMLVGCHPFDLEGNNPDAAVAKLVIQSDKVPPPLVNSEYTEHLSDSAIDLIQRLLSFDSERRLTAIDMLDHPWVRGETARKDVIENSDKKLSKFRAMKSGLERKVLDNLFTWSAEKHAEDATKRTSLIERSFKSFDTQQKGFLCTKDIRRQLQAGSAPDETGDERLSLSAFEELLSDNMKNAYFRKDQVVFHEGDEGNEMYFINSGVAEVSTKDGFKAQIKQGDFVGEGALLSPDKMRSATVTCTTPVHAIEITRDYFEKYLSASEPDVNLKMRERDKSRALNRTKCILRQQNELRPKEISRGDTLYKVGDEGSELFIVESGEVDVQAENVTVLTIRQGDIVGVPAVIASRRHGTSAVCASDKCKLHGMNANEFHRILRESPSLKKALYDVSYRREFQKAVVFHTKRPFPTDAAALREVFDIIDEDKSGTISLDEVHSMLKRLNRAVPEAEVQGIMTSLDIDQSNTVSFEEFKHIFGLEEEG